MTRETYKGRFGEYTIWQRICDSQFVVRDRRNDTQFPFPKPSLIDAYALAERLENCRLDGEVAS